MASSDKVIINIGSCAAATLVAEFATLPICTTKTVFQNGLGRPPVPFVAILNPRHLADPQTAVGHIWLSGGGGKLGGFYRASLPALGAQMLSTSGKYTIYTSLTSLLLTTPNPNQPLTGPQFANKMCIGLTSGILTSLVRTKHPPIPMFAIWRGCGGKCAQRAGWRRRAPLTPPPLRCCVHVPPQVTHPMDVCRTVLQRQQDLGREFRLCHTFLYRGYVGTLAKVSVGSALFLPTYDWSRTHIESPALAGAAAGLVVTTMIHPLDLLRTQRMGSNTGDHVPWSWSLLRCRGLSLNLARVVPHAAIVMSLTEVIKSQFSA